MLKRLASPEPAPPWGFAAAIGAVVAAFLAVVIGTGIAQAILGDADAPETITTGWAIGAVITIVFVLVSRQRRSPEDAAALRTGPLTGNQNLLFVMLFSLGFVILFDLISWVIVGDQTLAASELLNYSRDQIDTFGWIIALLFMGLLQPIAEELVFRGMLFPALRTNIGIWSGFLMCAAFHAAFHLLAYPPPGDDNTVVIWYGLLLPLLDGLFFTGVRAHTGSTRAAIAAHATFGIFAVLKVFAFTG